jgi:hypothetical protein
VLVLEQQRGVLAQAPLAPAVDDLLDRLPLAYVEQRHH